MHGARAALPETTAKARAMQLQLITQHVEERRVGIIHRHRNSSPVHVESDGLRHSVPSGFFLFGPSWPEGCAGQVSTLSRLHGVDPRRQADEGTAENEREEG